VHLLKFVKDIFDLSLIRSLEEILEQLKGLPACFAMDPKDAIAKKHIYAFVLYGY